MVIQLLDHQGLLISFLDLFTINTNTQSTLFRRRSGCLQRMYEQYGNFCLKSINFMQFSFVFHAFTTHFGVINIFLFIVSSTIMLNKKCNFYLNLCSKPSYQLPAVSVQQFNSIVILFIIHNYHSQQFVSHWKRDTWKAPGRHKDFRHDHNFFINKSKWDKCYVKMIKF